MANEEITRVSQFSQAFEKMIAKNVKYWNNSLHYYESIRKYSYTREEVEKIIESNSLEALQKLSREMFQRDGLYRRIIIYYATLLKYTGILIPNPTLGQELSTSHIQKRYSLALDYIERLQLPNLLTRFALRTLIDGCYYGLIVEASKTNLTIIDLPAEYCRSLFRDLHGNDVLEFNVTYFNSIYDKQVRAQVLKIYPKDISDHYKRYINQDVKSPWVRIPAGLGVCFPFFDECAPLFVNVIPATLDYDEAVDINRERDLEEIRKIIVQKIPHLTDGTLLFEPPEVEVMHDGAVRMLSGNKNISVLTSYGDVDAIVSKTSSEATNTVLEKSLQNVYSEASTSAQIFSPVGSQALPTSIKNDMALMMILARKFSFFISYLLNDSFASQNVNFKYTLLPISWYNTTEYITDTFKLAQSGYSFLLPALAADLSQRDLINVKQLENTLLKLKDNLIPLDSSYTQSSNPVGRPSLPVDEKSPKTLQNEESMDRN